MLLSQISCDSELGIQSITFDAHSKDDSKVLAIFVEILNELEKADKKHAGDPMVEPKVGFKTIECEMKELDRELERKDLRSDLVKHECVQVASMAVKFLRSFCY